ncbi:exonuclease domain-containing protein [Bacillus infantis]|uniref:3'-5' exonuclease n=1 Tax=Bacillus infantis TaxID=324767 RepID=A0A5D4RH23_9BACI|nr:exonuclease domain-containing protein [Bacillus infantis]TYS50160.1 3'-5' exonuclease [Bacillus infantis]
MGFESMFQMMKGLPGKLNSGVFGGMQGGQNSQQQAFLRRLNKEIRAEEALSVPLDRMEAIVMDIETTGFFPDQGDEIISIGAVKIENGIINEDKKFYSLIRYEKTLSPQIEQLTGIRGSQLKEAPPLPEVLIDFFKFCEARTIIAHHARHEKSFLQNASWKHFKAPLKHRIIDTSFLYRIAEPELNLQRLEDLCSHNGIPVMERHHALEDARLAAELWCCYISKVRDKGCMTLKDVYERVASL